MADRMMTSVVCKLLELGHAGLGHAELGQFCDSLHEKDVSVKM